MAYFSAACDLVNSVSAYIHVIVFSKAAAPILNHVLVKGTISSSVYFGR